MLIQGTFNNATYNVLKDIQINTILEETIVQVKCSYWYRITISIKCFT